MLPLQSTSLLTPKALVRYLLFLAATKQSGDKTEKPDGEILE